MILNKLFGTKSSLGVINSSQETNIHKNKTDRSQIASINSLQRSLHAPVIRSVNSSLSSAAATQWELTPGVFTDEQPSHLWLEDIGKRGMSPIAEQLRKKIAQEILVSKDDPKFGEKLVDSWRKYGFAAIRGDDVDPKKFEETYKVMEEVFRLSPKVLKQQLGAPGPGKDDGYIAPAEEVSTSSVTKGESENMFQFIHRSMGNNQNFSGEYAELGRRYAEKVDGLMQYLNAQSLDVAVAMAQGLRAKGFTLHNGEVIPDDYFVKLMQEDGKSSDLTLARLTHCNVQNSGAGAIDNTSCSSSHTDLNFFTMLPKATRDGLQIWYEDEENPANSGWVPLDAPEGSFILNLADMTDVLTGGYLKSTAHRVVSPPGEDRYSIIFFASLLRKANLLKSKLLNPENPNAKSRFEKECLPRLGGKPFTAENSTDLRKVDIGFIPADVAREQLGFVPIEDLEYMKNAA